MENSTRKEGNDTSGFFQNIGPWYMLRLKFMPTWLADKIGFNIFIHLFLQSDKDVPHDHPWDSYSMVLWGHLTERRQVPILNSSYHWEVVEYETPMIEPWTWKFRNAKYRHVVQLHSKWALTIFIPQATERMWYFYPEGRPIPWRTFLRLDK